MRKLRVLAPLALVVLTGAVPRAAPPPHVGPAPDGSYVVPTSQAVRRARDSAAFGGRPVDLALSPDGKRVYLKDNRGLVCVDAATWKVRQEIPFPKGGGGSMHGIAVSRDGRRVWASTAGSLVCEAAVSADGTLTWTRSLALPGPKGKDDVSYPCGLALSSDEKTLYVCLSRNNSVGVVDLASGALRRQIPVGVAPFDVVVMADGGSAWVSNWGGRRPRQGERVAPSSGTETLVDARGVAASGSVSLVDLAAGTERLQVPTGLHPSDIALSADGRTLFVANANSDSVTCVDVTRRAVRETLAVKPLPSLPFGSAPDALVPAPDGKTLYVACGGNNAVAVVALGDGEGRRSRVIGWVPAGGWYPGAVGLDDRNRLLVANVKGLGSQGARPKDVPPKARRVQWFLGTVSRIPVPNAAQLAADTRQVLADARIQPILDARDFLPRPGRKPVPIPERAGEPSVFRHVVYILKENRTYDQVFGDLAQGDGDASLCTYGRDVTPNHHALAEQFVLLDNYYCNGANSADGHSWATEGNVTDHLEKAFGGFGRSYTFGDDPLTYSSSGFLWDNALRNGRTFRNFGEMDYAEAPGRDYDALLRAFQAHTLRADFTHNIGIATLRAHSNPDYPGWNLGIPDVIRADLFLKELRADEGRGTFPSLVLVYLPSDHTSGLASGKPTPRSYLADNDLALGRVVEGISRSRFWPQTCIFVNEDDPQDGFDHVDGHRSLCLVISPYTKRGATVHNFYNQTSVLHTIEQMLGLPPMNQMDAMAPLMRACFTDAPDLRPFTCRPNRVPLGQMNPQASRLGGRRRYWARVSDRMNWSKPDDNDDALLNRILWHAAKGMDRPYPATPAP